MARKAVKQVRSAEKLTQEDKELLESFNRALEETSPLPGVTLDIRDIARRSVQAYWAAREQATAQPADMEAPDRIPAISRLDLVRHIWATIDPAREFMRELLSSALPTLAGFMFLVTGYVFLTQGKRPPLPWLPSALVFMFAGSAIVLILYFWVRRETVLNSKWRVLQYSSGSLAGGLIAGAITLGMTVFSLQQTAQVDRYAVSLDTVKEAAELTKTVNEIQPVAASILAARSTDVELDRKVEEEVRDIPLGREGALTVVSREPKKVVYRVDYKDGTAESTQPLTVEFTPDSINVQRQDKVEYTIVRGSIKDANDNSFELLVNHPALTERTLDVSNEAMALWRRYFEVQNVSSLKGKDVIVTFSFNENAPTRVDLIGARMPLNLYSVDILAERIQKLGEASSARTSQASFQF